jgi:hypothetical protein
MAEHEPKPDDTPAPDGDDVEELPDFDYADPLKREGDDELPGLDPAVTIPPE